MTLTFFEASLNMGSFLKFTRHFQWAAAGLRSLAPEDYARWFPHRKVYVEDAGGCPFLLLSLQRGLPCLLFTACCAEHSPAPRCLFLIDLESPAPVITAFSGCPASSSPPFLSLLASPEVFCGLDLQGLIAWCSLTEVGVAGVCLISPSAAAVGGGKVSTGWVVLLRLPASLLWPHPTKLHSLSLFLLILPFFFFGWTYPFFKIQLMSPFLGSLLLPPLVGFLPLLQGPAAPGLMSTLGLTRQQCISLSPTRPWAAEGQGPSLL